MSRDPDDRGDNAGTPGEASDQRDTSMDDTSGNTPTGLPSGVHRGGKGKTGVSSPAMDRALNDYAKANKITVKELAKSLFGRGVIGTVMGLIDKGMTATAALDKAIAEMGFKDPAGIRSALMSNPDFAKAVSEGDSDAANEILNGAGGSDGDEDGAGIPKSSMEIFGELGIPGLDDATVGDMYKGRYDAAEDAKGELEVEKENWNEFKKRYREGFEKIAGQYEEEIAGIPKLNVNVGKLFGGASIPMAPGKHVAVAGDKRTAREGGLTKSAGIESTALANVSNNVLNRYKIGHKQYDDPIQEALDIFSLDKTLANRERIAELQANTQKDINSGSIWDLIPAIAFGVGSL